MKNIILLVLLLLGQLICLSQIPEGKETEKEVKDDQACQPTNMLKFQIKLTIGAKIQGKYIATLVNNSNCKLIVFSSSDKQITKAKPVISIIENFEPQNEALVVGLLYKVNSDKKPKQFKYSERFHAYFSLTLRAGGKIRVLIPSIELKNKRAVAVPYAVSNGSTINPNNDAHIKLVYTKK